MVSSDEDGEGDVGSDLEDMMGRKTEEARRR